ncbi:CxxH/CxxC protein [Halalkalibacter oceani]|uniref:CxxH/CxxC protein n=1 Tax=Halalkalibacter oceani TaxID=1653776 RepID=A0A9X2DWJ0_9BACI|nr:CxxH/CxxC protein [Halalkalibacter oceani]MCM3716695.1 CxxH/CxxC protein [Halalkalibacter oceani]MCM3762818.1 CxxH/CxxC protein [Halalkalibacter oceani]
MTYYACHDHIDIALDTVVDEHESAPIMTALTEQETLSTACSFCEKTAKYKVEAE